MQHSNLNMLANNLNQMKNPKTIGISVGEVVKRSPLTISIAGGGIKLVAGDELLICDRLKKVEYDVKYTFSDQSTDTGKIEIDPDIQLGDKILVVPMEGEQTWIAIDRISEV